MAIEALQPFDPREHVDDVTVKIAEDTSKKFLEAFVQERPHRLRADLISKLTESRGIHFGNGWAIYTPEDNEGTSVATIFPQKETLLVMKTSKRNDEDGVFRQPSIRVMTNEPMISDEGSLMFFCQDFILDDDDSAQYFVSGAAIGDVRESLAAVFGLDSEGILRVNNNCGTFTPIPYIKEVGSDEEVMPFGYYDNPQDVLYAVKQATGILADLEGVEPYLICGKNNRGPI